MAVMMAVSDQLESSVEEEDNNDPQELVGTAARFEGAHRDLVGRHQEGRRVPGRRRRRRLRGRQESHRSGVTNNTGHIGDSDTVSIFSGSPIELS